MQSVAVEILIIVCVCSCGVETTTLETVRENIIGFLYNSYRLYEVYIMFNIEAIV